METIKKYAKAFLACTIIFVVGFCALLFPGWLYRAFPKFFDPNTNPYQTPTIYVATAFAIISMAALVIAPRDDKPSSPKN